MDRLGHRGLEGEGHRRHQPAARVREERRDLRRRRRPLRRGQWLRLGATELTAAQQAKYPHLKDYPAFTVDARDRDRVRESLRGQLIATQRAANGALLAATGVQTSGVLDELYGKAASGAARTRLP
ncbi:hypothetical protein NKH18_12590 [Streptomyces sp. M10(2022)]